MTQQVFGRAERTCSRCGRPSEVFRAQVEHRGSSCCGQEGRAAAQRQGRAERAARFWEKVDRHGPVPERGPHPGPCRLRTASLTSAGYGAFERDSRIVPAHRLAWELTHGPIPEGLQVLHTCAGSHVPEDVASRRCVNPAHPYAGTRTENVRDAMARGRWKRWGRQH